MALVRGTKNSETLDALDGVTNGADTIYGYGGNDTIRGLGGDDKAFGGDGNDTLVGGPGADALDGGAGIDVADYGDSTDLVSVNLELGTGALGTAQGDTYVSIEGAAGSPRGDVLVGNAGYNSLVGRDGNDHLTGGGGADFLDGGQGFDTARYDNSTGIFISLYHHVAAYGEAEGDVLTGIENIWGSDYDDVLWGDEGGNGLHGWMGQDSLMGFGGDDSLQGGNDHDVLHGGTGDDVLAGDFLGYDAGYDGGDTLHGDQGHDTIYGCGGGDAIHGDDGNDTLLGGSGTDFLSGGDDWDTLVGGLGSDVLRGGPGIDTASYYESWEGVVVRLLTGTVGHGEAEGDQLDGIENLVGSRYADEFWGDDGANELYGAEGDDLLKGVGGDDRLQGDFGDDTLAGMDGNDYVAGGSGDDALYGMDGDDRLLGGYGIDTMLGGRGNDIYHVDESGDVVTETVGYGAFDRVRASADYVLAPGSEVEVLETSEPDDLWAVDLAGNEFTNTIIGNNGQNAIAGGFGVDFLSGRGGSDTFAWTSVAETGETATLADIVIDFDRSQGDRIDLAAIDADAATAGDQAFTFVGTGPFTAPGQIAYAVVGTETHILLNTDADTAQEGLIRVLGLHTVDAGWFAL